MSSYLTKLKDIKALVFDVDGVFTDGTVTLLPDGNQIRVMNIKDGYAIQHAVKNDVLVAIISGGTSEAVRKRFTGLEVHHVYLGASYKMDVLKEFMLTFDLNLEDILYMGDDIPDYEIMSEVGLSIAPKDAAPEILKVAHYISPVDGGKGCVRDIVEQYLKVHNKWMNDEKGNFTW